MEASGKKLRLYLKALGSRKKRKLAPGEARDAASELVLFPKPMENPEEIQAPSEKEIIDAQQGNICRCITYNRIKTAIKRASEIMQGA